MKIGIDASRAFQKQRTGIEEYSYQVIKHLRHELQNEEIFLYIRKNQLVDFELPSNWKIKIIRWPKFWTQAGLSLEMLLRPVDVLFIPAHTVPFIHPSNTVVTVHGLEYERMPGAYSLRERFYMRWSIKMSCVWAKKIIAVSENTRKDLIELYNVPGEKIEMVYEGVDGERRTVDSGQYDNHKPYILFIGRIEKRKNIEGVIEAYKILKERHNVSHKLVLAGKLGYGYDGIKHKISSVKHREDIVETGYISEEEKHQLLENADVFLFPSFYEGFGLPILEAQSSGVPVVTSNISSLPEVGGDSVMYCNPNKPKIIAEAAYKIISNSEFRDGIIEKGYENIRRFSWEKCASSIAKLIID